MFCAALRGLSFLRSHSASCFQFLKAIILKTFDEIVLAFLLVESKTNVLYVNINYTRNYFLYSVDTVGKVFWESAVFHLFWALPLTKNVFSIFCSRWLLVNNSKNKGMAALLLCFTGFEAINFYIFFIKMSCFGSNLFFYK